VSPQVRVGDSLTLHRDRPAQAETPLLSPAINHFLLNSKKYYFSDRLGRRNQTSDHMIFVIADDSMLDVIDSEKSLKDYLKE
jgi:hypothetical protein